MQESPDAAGFRVAQIDHVEFVVPDRREAAEWYERVLGLRVVREFEHWAVDPHGPLMISSDGGSTKLALFEGAPQGSKEEVVFHLVALRVCGVDFVRFLARLSELDLMDHRGQPVTNQSAVDHAVAYSIYCCDPFAHQLELTTYDYDQVKAELAGLRSAE